MASAAVCGADHDIRPFPGDIRGCIVPRNPDAGAQECQLTLGFSLLNDRPGSLAEVPNMYARLRVMSSLFAACA
jgi:hypothetical protein